ncbi:receptor-type tyrosine-protein phosphatase T isoform X2 [Biomphalaria glabrata]|nr:receptor-type tyrosine-protein phosphatase T isoform X2 [Biomphalaria glabrata]
MTIRNTVNTTQLLDAISLLSGKSHVTFWTGARSIKFHGLYFWEEDDSVVESELWRHGEPHVPFSKRCVYLDVSGELGTWPCFVKRRFLCEAVEPTWYGDRNKFHCQCSQGLCDDIGSCLSGHMQCFPGWFGAKCEYCKLGDRSGGAKCEYCKLGDRSGGAKCEYCKLGDRSGGAKCEYCKLGDRSGGAKCEYCKLGDRSGGAKCEYCDRSGGAKCEYCKLGDRSGGAKCEYCKLGDRSGGAKCEYCKLGDRSGGAKCEYCKLGDRSGGAKCEYCKLGDRSGGAKCEYCKLGDRSGGAKCEYYDVARRQDKTYHVHEDNDPVCEHNLVNPYTLNLTSPVPFSFLRVIVTQAVDSTKMNFTLTLRSVQQTCQSTHIRMDHFTYDFICLYGPVYYDQLTLAWPRTVTLCAVYISKGHDVTFQQRVTFEGLKMASPEVVVDSIDSIGSLCTEQIPGETRQTVEIHLGLPQMITQITIARKRGVADYSHMKGLRIETLDTRMQTLVTFQLNSAYSDARVVSVLTFDNQTAAKIRISLEAFSEKSFIEICEINAYGECSPPFYGGDCLEVCPASCPYKACHIDDVCLWPCPAGTVGPQCKVPTIAAALNDGRYQAAASAHETQLGYKEIALIVAGVFFACLALVILVMHCLTKAASGVEMSLKEFLRLESEAGQMLHLSSTSIERGDSALSILVERLEDAARRQRNAALMKHILSKSLKVDDRSRPAAARHNVSPSIEFDEFDEEDYV